MLIFYFYLISFSIIGYGFILSKFLKLESIQIGFIGLLGLSFLILISYITSIFFIHDYQFNTLILVVGLIFFISFLYLKFNFIQKELKIFIVIFTLLVIFILVGKNHDDFSYYHFPYSYLLTQYSHPIGIGWLNNGFRNPSSLFFLSSLFYLPKVNFFLFHLAPAYFLGFSNLILLNLMFDKNIYNKIRIVNFLSLLVFLFINIFFYRLAEHGTDKSGQIIVFLLAILFILLINNNNKKLPGYENTKIILYVCIFLSVLISLKPFYLIYSPLIFVVFYYSHLKKNVRKILFSKTVVYCFLLALSVFFYNFINSGCLVYPANFTCFSNLLWSFDPKIIKDVNQWYELWAKSGATPNYIVEDREIYIKNFNWFNNWMENYFFYKVSDFLLGLLILISITYITFKKNLKRKTSKHNPKFYLIYFIIFILFIEWFLKHPALRYGGYQLIGLLLFIPFANFLSMFDIRYDIFRKKGFILIIICLTIFLARNLVRLDKELRFYNYNPFINVNYNIDKKFYFRYINYIEKNREQFMSINFFGKDFMLTKKNK